MSDDEDLQTGGEYPPQNIAEFRAALQRHREALRTERRRAQRWEREAVLRASTVAGSLMTRVLAAQRLAAVVERNLAMLSGSSSSAAQEVRNALELFREAVEDQMAR